MEIVSEPEQTETGLKCNVSINNREIRAINEAVLWYLQRHKEHESDLLVERLRALDPDIHKIRSILNPS